jgi:hypothetical protein
LGISSGALIAVAAGALRSGTWATGCEDGRGVDRSMREQSCLFPSSSKNIELQNVMKYDRNVDINP